MRTAAALAMLFLATACATTTVPVAGPTVEIAPEESVTGWRAIANGVDEARLAAMPQAWAAARATVGRRDRKPLADAGALLAADAALDHPALPPGSYKCWLTSLGRRTTRGAALRTFAPFFCYVRAEDGGTLSFTKQTGSDLPGGWLHDDGQRYVFLGARQREAGDSSLGYGTEPERDLAGVVERIGPFRWRLVLPWRDGKTGLDVYELTPVPTEQQAAEPAAP